MVHFHSPDLHPRSCWFIETYQVLLRVELAALHVFHINPATVLRRCLLDVVLLVFGISRYLNTSTVRVQLYARYLHYHIGSRRVIFAVLLLAVIEDVCFSNLVCVYRMASLYTPCKRRSACALGILVCCLFIESGVHALRRTITEQDDDEEAKQEKINVEITDCNINININSYSYNRNDKTANAFTNGCQ